MRESTTRYVLLGGLAAGGPMTGYDLRNWVSSSLGYFWSESFGQIYPELKRLSDEGLIASAPGTRRKDGPAGKPVTITSQGRAVLSAWLEREPAAERARSELLLKLSLGRFLGTETAQAFLTAARERANARAAALTETARAARAGDLNGEDKVFALLALDRGVAAARAEADWAERAARAIASLGDGGPDAALAVIARSVR